MVKKKTDKVISKASAKNSCFVITFELNETMIKKYKLRIKIN